MISQSQTTPHYGGANTHESFTRVTQEDLTILAQPSLTSRSLRKYIGDMKNNCGCSHKQHMLNTREASDFTIADNSSLWRSQRCWVVYNSSTRRLDNYGKSFLTKIHWRHEKALCSWFKSNLQSCRIQLWSATIYNASPSTFCWHIFLLGHGLVSF